MTIDPNSAAEVAGHDDVFSDEAPTKEDTAYFESDGAIEDEAPAEEARATEQPDAEENPAESDAEPDEVNDGEKQKFVPHQALHQEREKNKQIKNDLNRAQDRIDRLVELVQHKQQPQEPEYEPEPEYTPEPNAYQNPVGAVERLQQQVQQMNAEKQAEYEQRQYQSQVQNVVGSITSQLNEANAADPSVEQAYNHMAMSLRGEAQAAGYTAEQAAQWAQSQEAEYMIFAAQNNLNPADYLKSVAASRGWSAQAKETQSAAQPDLGDQIDRATDCQYVATRDAQCQ